MSEFEFVADELIGPCDEVTAWAALVEKVAYGRKLTTAEQAVYDAEIVPMLARADDLRERQHFDYLMSKDD